MNLARLSSALAPVVLVAGGCSATPDAADLVAEQRTTGPPVSESEAAVAMLEYIDTVNEALRSGDTGELAQMTGAQCPCRDLVGLIHERFAGGAELVGASFDAGTVTVLDRRGQQAEVRVRVSVSEYEVRNRDGLVVASRPAQQYVATYTLRMEDERWRVVDVRQDA